MKLYYAPGACSIGIHALVEEIGKPYEGVRLSIPSGDTRADSFTSVNPKGKVPTLVRDDGSVLTEFPAIAVWLARNSPEKGLLPSDADGEARVLEAMDYVVSTIHMQGFSRMLRPGNFAPSEADHETVKARGREIFEGGLKTMDKALAGKDWIAGPLSVADFALFYVEFWATARMAITLPPNCAAHFDRMKARPGVQKTLADEGFGG
ncbi:glutathione S-transferase family protein [Enterovirga rhinocerotis]|uniref:Glutathione S-transferase n=1 Tax=Enterovirga rhinocerotis TaxID=1339210 RepID=A0A4R7BNK4_9HYPH|nr:glutathione S-transferase C-terminal domain-containing protein [Enterovirga rhinocerotis]TDR87094.1 glutathione S-transferase [Enterovirga rhinocerotis]